MLLGLSLCVALAPPPGPQPVVDEQTGIQVGLPGKDVIWVPTPEAILDRMLAMAQVTAKDVVVDLGAGDGRMVIAAARKHGARGIGVELTPALIAAGRKAARRAGLKEGQVTMVQADLFTADIREATVVMLYLLPEMNRKLRAKLLGLRPGTRIVAHQFGIPEWEPDETSWVDRRAAHLWIVPAQVAGGWRITLADGRALDVDLEQKNQTFRGRVHLSEGIRPEGPWLAVKAGLRATSLRGAAIRFEFVDAAGLLHAFSGVVDGETMAGEVVIGERRAAWSAARRR
ncbi:MAG: class I SAM-dependent methyltransferase [Myxococcales bacterium]|nr:class I SAM-dependent methyltransferase [Myxococcales bacterium]